MVDTSFPDPRRPDYESKWRVGLSILLFCVFANLPDRFRWVECQFKSLKSCPRSEDHLEKLLKSLPQSLDETYERMLLSIDTASIDYARRILMWLCFSKRPLTVPELIDGVAVELGDHARLNRKRRLYDGNDLLQICSGFISITLKYEKPLEAEDDQLSYIVSLAHYSVQEYLESNRLWKQEVAFFSMRGSTSDVEIAQTCLVYLLDPTLSNAEVTYDTLIELPLFRYAASYWYEYVKKDEPLFSRTHSFMLQLFVSRDYTFRNCITIHNPDQPWRRPFQQEADEVATPIYYSSLLGLHPVLCALLKIPNENAQMIGYGKTELDENADVNAQGGYYGNALQAALSGGHEKVVQLLLEKNADVNAQGGYYGNAL
jgi:ankyrin repeat domain-containing protein 50